MPLWIGHCQFCSGEPLEITLTVPLINPTSSKCHPFFRPTLCRIQLNSTSPKPFHHSSSSYSSSYYIYLLDCKHFILCCNSMFLYNSVLKNYCPPPPFPFYSTSYTPPSSGWSRLTILYLYCICVPGILGIRSSSRNGWIP